MASIGKLGKYNPDVKEWTQYTERMTYYFTANDITTDAKKKATFLAVVGLKAYALVRTLIAPSKISDKSLQQLMDVLQEHYSPKPSATKFYNLTRKSNETVTAFQVAEFCDFGNKLDDMLRDRLICGINDKGHCYQKVTNSR